MNEQLNCQKYCSKIIKSICIDAKTVERPNWGQTLNYNTVSTNKLKFMVTFALQYPHSPNLNGVMGQQRCHHIRDFRILWLSSKVWNDHETQ